MMSNRTNEFDKLNRVPRACYYKLVRHYAHKSPWKTNHDEANLKSWVPDTTTNRAYLYFRSPMAIGMRATSCVVSPADEATPMN